MTVLTREKADELLDRAIAEKGEGYQYDPGNFDEVTDSDEYGGCRYYHGKTPGCIIGHVMHYLGIGPRQVFEGNGIAQQPFSTDTVATLGYLEQIQERQDDGDTWGMAVSDAREEWPTD